MTQITSSAAGALTWGVKQSLGAYVRDGGGTIVASDGAHESGVGFRFCLRSRLPDNALAFAGRVEFTAYGGLLHFVLANPVLDPGAMTLSVEDRRGDRVDLARLVDRGWQGGRVQFAATLAPEGAGVFDGMYPLGTGLDPITIPDDLFAQELRQPRTSDLEETLR